MMDLWIRSQDLTKITKFSGACIEHTIKDVAYSIKDDKGSIYGWFKTEEKALEVLDEIHTRLVYLQFLETAKGQDFKKINFDKLGEENLDCVYQIPFE